MVLEQFEDINYKITDAIDNLQIALGTKDKTISIRQLYKALDKEVPKNISNTFNIDTYGWRVKDLQKCWFISPVDNAVFWVDYDNLSEYAAYVLIIKNPVYIKNIH